MIPCKNIPNKTILEIIMATYTIHKHAKYGKYVNFLDFKTKTNTNSQAIEEALKAAHKENAAVYLKGTLKIDKQIVIDASKKNVTGLFGDGMGKTKIVFDKPQKGIMNPNTNDDDLRSEAGILIDGQNGKTIADLSVQYTGEFYRTGQSYFGKVNGILVNDADNTLISKVEVYGANRAGVLFTSTSAVTSGAKNNLITGKITEDKLPTGDNNKIVDSYLHHNRVAGALVAYQKNFTAEGNKLAWNGHKNDGGTGYGIATQAGSYNNRITFSKNTTDHNYRKGIDSHDGNNIVIKDNTLNGDRLYGIAVENRQFSTDRVVITGNKINQDPSFRLGIDDDINPKIRTDYADYRGIKLENKAQPWQDFHNPLKGDFTISNNTINGIQDGTGLTRAIEVRNNEKEVSYNLKILNNNIKGHSADNLISIFGNSDNPKTNIKETGAGSGVIQIRGNTMEMGKISDTPISIQEANTNGRLHGSIGIEQNKIVIQQSNGSPEGASIISNAENILVRNNTFELHGSVDKPVININGLSSGPKGVFNLLSNKFITDMASSSFKSGYWIKTQNVIDKIVGNTHNGTNITNKISPTAKKFVLSQDEDLHLSIAEATAQKAGRNKFKFSMPIKESDDTIEQNNISEKNEVNDIGQTVIRSGQSEAVTLYRPALIALDNKKSLKSFSIKSLDDQTKESHLLTLKNLLSSPKILNIEDSNIGIKELSNLNKLAFEYSVTGITKSGEDSLIKDESSNII